MDEFPWGQWFTAVAALGGAAIGSWGTSWGALRREKAQREAEPRAVAASREHEVERARFDSLVKFADAYTTMVHHRDGATTRAAHLARAEFLATLRPGETKAGTHTSMLLAARTGSVTEAADRVDELFEWLRGETTL